MTDVQSTTHDHAVVAVLSGLSRGGELDDAGAAVLEGFTSDAIDDGSRLQLEVLAGLQAAGEKVGGWKIGWTSRGARTGAGGQGDRPFGYVLESRVLPSGATLDLSSIPGCKLEPEIAVVMGDRLGGPDVTPEQARAAVSAVAPAFEICSSRLRPGLSMGVRVGNALNNFGIVVGEQRSSADLDLAALTVQLSGNDVELATGSSGPDVLDDPFVSLSRVARLMSEHGLELLPGQVLITGSLCAPAVVQADTRYDAEFGDLGSVSVTFG
jgi:2-keto-4-pentenoate hydratase